MHSVVFIAEKNGDWVIKRLRLTPEGRVLRCDVIRIFDKYIDAIQYKGFLDNRFKIIKEVARKREMVTMEV